MPTLMQKLRLAFRGWQRRRDEAGRAFVAQNTGWGSAPVPPPSTAVAPHVSPGAAQTHPAPDLEGLQVAYLDESGQIDYYLDIESGDVMEFLGEARGDARARADGGPLRAVPKCTIESELADRVAFANTLGPATRAKVKAAATDAAAFRAEIAKDRAMERAWYNFKNERATAAVAAWLRAIG